MQFQINKDKIFNILNQKPYPKILYEAFKNSGFEIRFVGGCIRDAILNQKEIHDIDFASNAKPEEMQEILKKNNIYYYDSGLKHGTITAVFEKISYEITSLRIDQFCDGRHADVLFSASWEEDASRRDFTFNAFYMDFQKNFYDYFDGLNDLLNKKLRFIGFADERITEDYLRILRALRFFNRYCEIGFEKNSETLNSIKKFAYKLNLISGERISSEVLKIFDDSNAEKNINNLKYFNICGIEEFIFLEKKELNFKILFFMLKLTDNNHEKKVSAINKIGLFLFENKINPERLKKRWALSKKHFNILKKIFMIIDEKEGNQDICNLIHDFFINPKKYLYLYFEMFIEFLICLLFLINKKINIINFDICSIHSFLMKLDLNQDDILYQNFITYDDFELCFIYLIQNSNKLVKPEFKIDATYLINLGVEKGRKIGFILNFLENKWLNQNCIDFKKEEINEYIIKENF
jgi:tRNA nucleotidyltransferase/poly(A) polymerase